MEAICRNLNRNLVPIFSELGERIREKWQKYEYTENALPDVASDELYKASLSKHISPESILDLALLGEPSLSTYQTDSPFGDIQLITYRHARFYIEALYWLEGTTAIHDHGFSGAFTIVSGSTINAEYKFQPLEKINHHFFTGKLSHPIISKLTPGSIQPIFSGQRFIHAAFHLEKPTLSIVIRTLQDDDAMPQFEYRGTEIRLVSDFYPEFAKKIQTLRLIQESNIKKFNQYFKHIFRESPSDEQYWLCRAFFVSLKRNEELWGYLSLLKSDKIRCILNSIEDEKLLKDGMILREKMEDAELKYFVALLLNIPMWEDLVQYTKKYYPEKPTLINNWLEKAISLGYNIPDKLISSFNLKEILNKSAYNKGFRAENVLYTLLEKKLKKC